MKLELLAKLNITAKVILAVTVVVASVVARPANGQYGPRGSQAGTQSVFDQAEKALDGGDVSTAVELLTPLAQKGNAGAQSCLGVAYQLAKNYEEAARWYRLAANQGEAEAQLGLGHLYERGQGLPKDIKEANRLFRLAADQNDGEAQYSLAASYASGEGFPKDYLLAYMWITLSNSGAWLFPDTKPTTEIHTILGNLAGKMTKAQIADAQRLVREWKPKVNPVSCTILKDLCRPGQNQLISNGQMLATPQSSLHSDSPHPQQVVPIFNVPGVINIKFSGDVLAKIYLGKITQWSDSSIAKDNPGVHLPDQKIVVVHRSDGSGTTYNFTEYLSKVSSEWANGPGKSTSISWPVGIAGKGNEGVAGLVSHVPGGIGYVDTDFARQNHIPFGAITK